MSKVVTIDNLARLEGHASVALYINKSGNVEKAEYIATEPSRGFDMILKGKHASEIPRLAARICGICYTPHNIVACKALEDAWGTVIPRSAKKIRELIIYANTLSSHALHNVFLAGPGLLIGGPNAISDLKKKYPDFLEAGIKLRAIGQDISEIIAGRKVHTIIAAPGGVLGALSKEKQDSIMDLLDSADEHISTLGEYTRKIVSQKKNYMLSFGKIDTHFLSLKQGKRLELYDAPLELLMKSGKKELLTPVQLLDRITEEEKDYSYVRHPYLTKLGAEGGQFRVGPLPRIQKAKWDNPYFHDFKKNFGELTQSTMGYDAARIAEMAECVREMKNIIDSGLDNEIKNIARPRDGVGVAVVEAPRGILLHYYETDKNGIIKKARVIAPTTFHQGSIERTTFEAARMVLKASNGRFADEEKVMIEQAIRAYDPCMSCAGATQLRIIKREA